MTRFNIAILLAAAFVIISCKKESNNTEGKSTGKTSVISIDGWEITKSNLDFHINPRAIYFVSDDLGFVVGYNGDIYKTTDSGINWQKQNSGTTLHLHSVFFLNENIGFAGGQVMNGCLDADCDKGCVFLKTTNGGATWTKAFFPDYSYIRSLKFFDELKGIALIDIPEVSNSGSKHIARTIDGGISWELIDLPVKPAFDKFFCVNNIIYIEGENQRIFRSSDFGNNWLTINTPVDSRYYIRNLYFYNENIGFIDGVNATYKTTDGGSTWIKILFPFSSFHLFHFYNEYEGINIETISAYEGGDLPVFKGSVYYVTRNGGEGWSKSDLIDSLHLAMTYYPLAHFPERNLGYAINSSEFFTIKKKD